MCVCGSQHAAMAEPLESMKFSAHAAFRRLFLHSVIFTFYGVLQASET